MLDGAVPSPERAPRRAFRIDAVALKAYVVQSATAAREELANAAIGIDRLQQFDFTSARIQQRGLDALIRDGRAFLELQSERIAPELEPLFEVRHHHTDMMNPL